ncbi:MAG: hypothetical protein ACI8QW_000348 [Saprospiraceae bacterium]|jgi:hypothetical protein
MKETLLIILLLFIITKVTGQTVLINEFMSKNNITIPDTDGDFSDWIEVYNTSNSIINLQDYSLSDDISDLGKWGFPEVHILPYDYLLIFASDKNIIDTTELHTNFQISSSGEALFLTNNSGVLIDQTNPVNLSDDESFCRVPDGSINWIVTESSSPNTTNYFSNQLVFSHQEGFYSSDFILSINSVLGDSIYYTLNGDVPTENSNFFIGSLLVQDRSAIPNIFSEIPTSPEQDLISYKAWESPSQTIDKATPVRCASYRDGIRTSDIYTKTYFVDNEIEGKYSMPVISLITEEENFFNNDSGLYVAGTNYNIDNPEWTGNYFMHGENWERDIHIEYFDSSGILGFSQDAGVRIHGGKTRQAAQKSLRFYARESYGEKHFNYNLLPQRQVNKYKRFILRSSMGSWGGETIIKDALAQNISSTLDVDYQEFQPVIVFLNGEYWGIQTIRDRIDERYIEYTHNIDKDSVEFNYWGNATYDSLVDFIENNGLEDNSNYEYVKTQIDIKNYIDYTISELFFKNYDWPANNTKLWRKIPDGKWRWVLYDIDAGFGNENFNMLIHATKNDPSITWPNSPSSTLLFRKLLQNELFKTEFISRYVEILNGQFNTETMTNKLDSIKAIYEPEIIPHIERWNYPNTLNDWELDIQDELSSFIEKRPCVVREHIVSFFELTSFDFYCNSTVNGNNDPDHLILRPNPNDGNFFLANTDLDIENATITITSVNGQVIHRESNVDILKNERKYFYLSNTSNNVYILQIVSDNYSGQKKIIITN